MDNNCNGGDCIKIELIDVSTQTEQIKIKDKFKDKFKCGKRQRIAFIKIMFFVFTIIFILLIFYTTMISS